MGRTATSATCETRLLALAAILAVAVACGGGGGGGGGGAPNPTQTAYQRGETVPELRLAIEGLSGASGAGGEFRPGDRPAVHFRLTKEDGSDWQLGEMSSGEALASGPSFNYQRVLPLATNVIDRASRRQDGSFVYVFAALPARYAPPLNDSPSFGPEQGELAGQMLLDGTYTAGLSFAWDYTVDGVPFQRVGEATVDFLLGTGAGTLAHREVTRLENCNQCHVELQAHEGRYRDFTLCLLCHTSGAEDANDPGVEDGTPGVSIDSRILFHRLHSGRSLPSVQGVTTNVDGSRNYAAAPVPLRFARSDGTLRDYSQVAWPVMPNREQPMPRDLGHSALPASAQAAEDLIRTGPSTCFVCHGDPDGAGPLGEPTHGRTVFAQPSRKACGTCHDDVDWTLPYTANLFTMPPQLGDDGCMDCHAPESEHTHPLRTDAFNEGIHTNVMSVAEAGANDGDGTFDPGERIEVTLSFTDDFGATVPKSKLESIHAVLSGPVESPQVLLDIQIPGPILIPLQPFTFLLPERAALEFVGVSSAAAGETFTVARPPIRHPDAVEVRVRTGTGAGSALAAAVPAGRNFADVLDGSPFQRGNVVVLDDGLAGEEYLIVGLVEGDRLWFAAPNVPNVKPGFALPHATGATIDVAFMAGKTQGVDYAVDDVQGTITELTEFGAGNVVLASYTRDFVVPARYRGPANDSPDLDETSGEWSGKTLVDGSYALLVRATRRVDVDVFGEVTTYHVSSSEGPTVLLFGSAAVPQPYTLLSPPESCNACHQDLEYHDGRYRGPSECLTCHAASGLEDVPRYVAANAPATPGTTVAFRSLVHRIHRGQELAFPDAVVVGAGAAPYPDNFTARSYERVLFPVLPGRTLQCAKCHGDANTAALYPHDRGHPSEQGIPVHVGRDACATCHDAASTLDHIDQYTLPGGIETCADCHGPGEDEDVVLVHEGR